MERGKPRNHMELITPIAGLINSVLLPTVAGFLPGY